MKQTLREILFIVTGSLMFLLPAFYNGYPIVYSDTSTYIASGFEFETPFDRPITYGLFLWLTSLNGLSLWTVIFVQSLVVSAMIRQLVKIILPDIGNGLMLLLYLLLAVCTSLPWTVSQLMPDIFTPVMLISACLILFSKTTRRGAIGLYILFTISTAMHMSHIPVNVVFLFLLILCKWIFKKNSILNSVRYPGYLLLFGLTLLCILTMGSALSKSRHAFFMGAMVEHGIAKAYLDKHCGDKQFVMCSYRDSLELRAYEFLWDKDSPFYKMGGFPGTKEEFNKIISGTITEPEFIMMHITESIKATSVQCTLFGIGDGNGDFAEGTELAARIEKYVPDEYETYVHSRQNQRGLKIIEGWNKLIYLIVIISIVAFLVKIIWNRRTGDKLYVAFTFLLIYILINLWSSATFANAIDRLGSKVMWLVPLIALLWWGTVISSTDAELE